MKPLGFGLLEALLGATILSLLLASSLYLYQHSRQLAQQSQASLALGRLEAFLLSQMTRGQGVPAQPDQSILLTGSSLAQIWLTTGQNLADPQRYRATLRFLRLENQPTGRYGLYQLTSCVDELCRTQTTLGALPTGQAWGSENPMPQAPGQITLSISTLSGCAVEATLVGPAFQQTFRQPDSQLLQLATGPYQLVAQVTPAPPPYNPAEYHCVGSPSQSQITLAPGQTQTLTTAYSPQPRPR